MKRWEKTATKARKRVKKAPLPKKAPKSPEVIETDYSSEEEEEETPRMIKGKKYLLCWGWNVFLIFNREKRWKG